MSVENLVKAYRFFDGIGYGDVMVGDELYVKIDLEYDLSEVVEIFEDGGGDVVLSMYSSDNNSTKDLYFTADQLAEATFDGTAISIMEEDVKITIKPLASAPNLDNGDVFKSAESSPEEESPAALAAKI